MKVIEVREIEIGSIIVPPWAERTVMLQAEIAELAESIRSSIQIEPIVVRRLGSGRYELISGFMRLNALKSLGLRTVEAKIVECSDDEALMMSVEENLKRTDTHPFDLAKKIAYMSRVLGLSIREIGRRLGRDHSWVIMMLSIDSISSEAKKILAPSVRDVPILYEVSRIEDVDKQVIASKIITKARLGRGDTSNLVKNIMARSLEDVEKGYGELLKESKDFVREDLSSPEVVNMLTTSTEYKDFSRDSTSKPHVGVEADELRRCEICGEEKPRRDIRYVGICREKHEPLRELLRLFKKYGYEKTDRVLSFVVDELTSLLAYPAGELSAVIGFRDEVVKMLRGLDLEMLREVVEKVRERHAEG
jgi:ParB family chromosome partitioning protein